MTDLEAQIMDLYTRRHFTLNEVAKKVGLKLWKVRKIVAKHGEVRSVQLAQWGVANVDNRIAGCVPFARNSRPTGECARVLDDGSFCGKVTTGVYCEAHRAGMTLPTPKLSDERKGWMI